jgi:hypothetical protein
MITTNQMVSSINNLLYTDFYKNSGTIYLNSPNTGLYVSNSAVFGGNVSISGPTGTFFEIRSPSYLYNTLSIRNASQSIIADGSIKSNGTISASNSFSTNTTVNTALSVLQQTRLFGNTIISGNNTLTGNTVFYGEFKVKNGPIVLTGDLYETGISTFTGNTSFNGDTFFDGTNHISGLTIVSGDANFDGNLISTNKADLSGVIVATGNTTISGNSLVTGNTTFAGKTFLTGNTSLYNTINVFGTSSVSGTTSFSNTVNLSSNTNLTGNIFVTGKSTISGNTVVTGNSLITGITTFNNITNLANNTYLSSNTFVSGITVISGNTSVTGDSLVSGVTTFSGNTNLTNNIFTTGKSIISGNTNITGATLVSGTTTFSNTVNHTSNTNLSGTSTFTGLTNFNNIVTSTVTLNSTGNTNLLGTSVVSGPTTISGNTTVTGASLISGVTTFSNTTTSINTLTSTGNTNLTGINTISGNTTLTGILSFANTANFYATSSINANGSIKSDQTISALNLVSDNLRVNTSVTFNTSNVKIKNTDNNFYSVISTKDLNDANSAIYRDLSNTNQSIINFDANTRNYVNTTFVKFGNNGNTIAYVDVTSNNIITDNLVVRGNLVSYGATVTDSSQYVFLYSTGSTSSGNTEIVVNRSGGSPSIANAMIRWYNGGKQWQIRDVDTGAFNKITTQNELDGANTFLTSFINNKFINSATFSSDLSINGNLTVNGLTTTINTNTLSVDDKNVTLGEVVAVNGVQLNALSTSNGTITLISGTTAGLIPGMTITKVSGTGNTGISAIISSVDSLTQITSSVNNSIAGAFVANIGGASEVTANAGGITLKGAADKTFNWYSSTSAWTSSEHLALASGKTFLLNGSTSGTTTVQPSSIAGGTLTLSANTGNLISTGDTGTVTNAMLFGSITGAKLSTSTVTNDKLANNTVTIGSSVLSLGSSYTNLANVSNISYVGSISGNTTLQASAAAGGTLTLSANTGYLISTGDTGTVTNAMLFGAITNNKLANSSITIGTTNIALGSTNTTIKGLTAFGFANTLNSSNTVTLVSDNAGGNSVIIIPNQSGTLVLSGAGGSSGSITSSMIANAAITNVHISETAAITTNKLAANTISGVYLGNNLANLTGSSGISVSNTNYNGSKVEAISVDSTVARNTSNLSYFSATTSAQLASVISDETGTGKLVFANNATLVAPDIGSATGTSLTLTGDLIVSANLYVNGLSTTLNVTELKVDDKNISLGDVVAITNAQLNALSTSNGTIAFTSGTTSGLIPGMAVSRQSGTGQLINTTIVSVDSATQFTVANNPTVVGTFIANIYGASDITANAGGITLKGSTDKTFNWYSATSAWTSSEHLAIASNKNLILNGSSSGSSNVQASAVAGGTLTLSANTGYLISTGDTGTVTNNMLFGSIPNNKLANYTISGIQLGSTLNALSNGAGLMWSTGANYTGNTAVTLAVDSSVARTTGTLGQFAQTSSAVLAGVLNDETGTGSLVFNTNPTFVGPNLGAPLSGNLANCTNLALATGVSGYLGTGNGGTGNTVAAYCNLNTNVYNNLAVGYGGTGQTSITANSVILGNGSNPFQSVAPGATGNVLTSQNGTWASVSPGSDTTVARNTSNLAFFAATTSAQLAGVISDETGSGKLVFDTNATLTNPTINNPVMANTTLGTVWSGNLANCTVDGSNSVGFRNIPINAQSAPYTTVLSDAGKCIYHPATDANARSFTIDDSVGYPVGTAISFVNMTSQTLTIVPGTNVSSMNQAGTGSSGNRTLAQYGTATALKLAAGTWLISGVGLT